MIRFTDLRPGDMACETCEDEDGEEVKYYYFVLANNVKLLTLYIAYLDLPFHIKEYCYSRHVATDLDSLECRP